MRTLLFLILFTQTVNMSGQSSWKPESVGVLFNSNMNSYHEMPLEDGLSGKSVFHTKTSTVNLAWIKNRIILTSAIGASVYEINSEYDSRGGITGRSFLLF